MSFGGGYSPDNTRVNAQATVAREMWNRYQERFVPLEEELIDYAKDPVARKQEASDAAISDYEQVTGNNEARTLREAARYGGLTADQRESMTKQNSLKSALGKVHVGNTASRAVNDRLLGLNQALVAQGRGLVDEANKSLGVSASLEASRNSANAANAASSYASTMSTIGTIGAGVLIASSVKFKENIEAANVDDLISKLNSIDIHKFNYKEELTEFPRGDFYGPLVEEMPREFVYGDNANMYNLVGALIATVQEQNRRIQELENK